MRHFVLASALALICCLPGERARSAEPPAAASTTAASPSSRAYGEWRIRVRPDKAHEYPRLIEIKGLPLFRGAGGRMVGWWTTLVGDLYEHVTVWEYDDMPAFERAVGKLGADPKFAEFVAQRDPLLAGESNRFLQLADFATPPALPEQAKIVIHEIHRVPLARRAEYLRFMESEGLGLLKKHGFRPVGPWLVNVGNWNDVTYLFAFDSLAERDKLRAAFGAHADGHTYSGKIHDFTTGVTTRVLMPAAFAHPPAPAKSKP